jgi:hypothetical protein
VALTGGGLARLCGELAEILPGADVVICGPAGHPLASAARSGVLAQAFRDASGLIDTTRLSESAGKDARTGAHWAAGVIRAGDMRYTLGPVLELPERPARTCSSRWR